MPLQIRRGTTAERLSITPVPGELIYDTDVGTIYVGDGTTPGGVNALIAGVLTTEEAVDAVAAALILGQNQNITFSYNAQADFDNRIDAAVDLSSYSGTISATAFKGQILAADDSVVYNPVTREISAGPVSSTLITAQGNIIPGANVTYDIGTSALRFREMYLSGTGISIGDARITSTGNVINLPIGSTVGGIPIGSGGGIGIGDGVVEGANYKINIVSQDFSTIMVNTETQEFIGDLTGNVTGNVDADSIVSNRITVELISAIDSAEIFMTNALRGASDIYAEGSFIGDLEGNSTGLQSSYNEVNVDFLGSLQNGLISVDSLIRSTEDIITTGNFIGNLSGSVIASTVQTNSLTTFAAEIPDLITSSISSVDSSDLLFVNRSIFQSDVVIDGDISIKNLLIDGSLNIDNIIISNNVLDLNGVKFTTVNVLGRDSLEIGAPNDPCRVSFHGTRDDADDVSFYNVSNLDKINFSFYTNLTSLEDQTSLPDGAGLTKIGFYARTNSVDPPARSEGYGLAAALFTEVAEGFTIDEGAEYVPGTIGLVAFNSNDPNDVTAMILEEGVMVSPSIQSSGYVQFGKMTQTERDAYFNDLVSSGVDPAGMIVYNTTVNKFQGFQSGGNPNDISAGAWFNLDGTT
jgi:hypothetical protein